MKKILLLIMVVFFLGTNLLFSTKESLRVLSSIDVLNEITKGAQGKAPKYLLSHAKGVIILPGVKKVGFFAGIKFGKGVILVKKHGKWCPPSFITLSGGSFGIQFGAKTIDVVLVLMTDSAVKKFAGNKIKLGVDIGVTAGLMGKEVGISQDDFSNVEVFSYAREKGIFIGVMLSGSVITHDNKSNYNYYKENITFVDMLAGKKPKNIPPEAKELMHILEKINTKVVAFIF